MKTTRLTLSHDPLPPTIENTTPDISVIIKETGNTLGVFGKGIEYLNAPKVLFTQDDDLDPMELVKGEATQTKTPLDNGGMTPLPTQSPYKYPPLVETSDAMDSLNPGTQRDASVATLLASVGYLPRERLTAGDDNIFGVYQDWVHQNPGTHLGGGI